MNLLSLLLTSLLTKEALSTISAKTGISKDVLKKLLPLAIPILIRYLTKNAASSGGAQSLFSALGQHSSRRTMAQQIEEGDEEDGGKIIRHILGNDRDEVAAQLAKRSGIGSDQVMRILALIAPAILSGLSAASNSAHQQAVQPQSSGPDLSSLMSMFGAAQQSQPAGNAMGGLGLLGTLLGAGASAPTSQMQNQGAASVFQQTLSNAQPSAQPQPVPMQLGMNGLQPAGSSGASSASGLTSLFGSMLGAGAQQSQQPTTEGMLDGSDLISILSAFRR